ncbi:Mannan polymerase complex subunit MNN9 [Phytophthora citrophthora]|uniref:Mannan polymerase complex subunit MNN9 n=1 Tax=Phytophthora citrophthora TaxID=4793 RepID=A0AAD9GA69_9STRA|nr:Mannan polymerase complex subunit MNN9 [Phytophthora citrophthora]
MSQEMYQRWHKWRLKKGRKGLQRTIAVALVAVSLLLIAIRTVVVPPTSFFRAPSEIVLLPSTSVLHPNTPSVPALNTKIPFATKKTDGLFPTYLESFPQHGKDEPGLHFRLENTHVLGKPGSRDEDSILFIVVFNDAGSWGSNRSVNDYFQMLSSMELPKEKQSVGLLTSSMDEFLKVKEIFKREIQNYARLSVIYRDDFSQGGLTRDNRHDDNLQLQRRRMLARYRNYALISFLETWHQHVIWLDADIVHVPPHLPLKMIQSGLDIVTPICMIITNQETNEGYDYDLNAWVGRRKVRQPTSEEFVPGPLSVKYMHDLQGEGEEAVPLDSVGGTMIYIRADVHRQGVIFPHNYIIGSEWGREGYDGIETEGLCYSAHFLGYKCWGMPNEAIHHAM